MCQEEQINIYHIRVWEKEIIEKNTSIFVYNMP